MNTKRSQAFDVFKSVQPPSDFDVKGAETIKSPLKEKKKEKKVHVFMEWPESMKDAFDDLYYQDRRLRKSKKKNELLIEWCLAGMKALEKVD